MKSKLKAKNLGTTVIKPKKIIQQPFYITFNWNEESITIQLKNGEDIFKIAHLFTEFLTKNEIEYIIS